MHRTAKRSALFLSVLLLGGCDFSLPADPPPDIVLEQGMRQSLLDTGFYTEVEITRIIGRHYKPSTRSWNVLACFRFSVPTGEQAETCVDSFQALELDNGTWVLAVTIEGVYRWRAIDPLGESQGSPGPVGPSSPG